MTPDYLLCDGCEAKIPKNSRTFVTTERKTDESGSPDSVGFNLDLCAKCWSTLVCHLNYNVFGGFKVGQAIEIWSKKNTANPPPRQ